MITKNSPKTSGNIRSSATKLTSKKEANKVTFPLGKTNFILMAISGAMIILGFILMSGEGSTMEQFNPDIFSTRRIVVGPGIAFIGFIAMAFSIIYRSKKDISE